MTLSDIATFSTAASGVTVTVSLIYLIIQTRQNVRHTRALIQQGAAARTTAIRSGMLEGDRIVAFLEGNQLEASPKAVRQMQFNIQCRTALDALEDHYLQHKARLVDPEPHARAKEDFRGLFSLLGVREYWNEVRTTEARIAPSFCAFVDSLCDADPVPDERLIPGASNRAD